MGEGRHRVRWSPEFPGAGRREHGASGCVHAPLTELLAAGQPLITRGPASPLAPASHTFAADWPAPGPALYPARGAGQAERLPEWGGGQTARSAVASTSGVSVRPSVAKQPAARRLSTCGQAANHAQLRRFSPASLGKLPGDAGPFLPLSVGEPAGGRSLTPYLSHA